MVDNRDPVRAVRVENSLWEPALLTARSRGQSLAQVIRRALKEYLADHNRDRLVDVQVRIHRNVSRSGVDPVTFAEHGDDQASDVRGGSYALQPGERRSSATAGTRDERRTASSRTSRRGTCTYSQPHLSVGRRPRPHPPGPQAAARRSPGGDEVTARRQTTTGVRQRHTKTCQRTGPCRCPWAWSFEPAADRMTGDRIQLGKGGYRTRKDALEARNEVVQRHTNGLLARDRRVSVEQYLQDWFQRRTVDAEKPLRATTAKSYADHIARFLVPTLGKIRLAELQGEDIERAMARIRREHPNLSASSRHRIYATLRSALRAAVKRKIIPLSPTDSADLVGHRRHRR